MLKVSANISLLFCEYPFLDRFQAAADAGFTAVEIQFPYEEPLGKVKSAAEQAGVKIVLINSPVLPEQPFGLAGKPELQDKFRAGLAEPLTYARGLGVKQVNILAGTCSKTDDRKNSLSTLRDNLSFAADYFAGDGIGVNLELINTCDVPGYLVHHLDDVLNILTGTDKNIGFQFDIYHLNMMGLDVAEAYHATLPYIRHIQFADAPGRHEPGTGTVDMDAMFNLIETSGYTGWVGAEYRPKGKTEDGLGWFNPRRAVSAG